MSNLKPILKISPRGEIQGLHYMIFKLILSLILICTVKSKQGEKSWCVNL